MWFCFQLSLVGAPKCQTNTGYEPNSVKLWRVVVVMVGVVHYGISIGYGV